MPFTPKDSLLLSLSMGCLPGIIYNLKKWRQIECQYASCLKFEVAQGVSPATCDSTRSYLKCKYVFGEIFNLIPFAHFVKFVGGMIQAFLHDPAALLFGSAVVLCKVFPSNANTAGCILARNIPELASIVADIKNGEMLKVQWKLKEDICAGVFEDTPTDEEPDESEDEPEDEPEEPAAPITTGDEE